MVRFTLADLTGISRVKPRYNRTAGRWEVLSICPICGQMQTFREVVREGEGQ